VNINSRIVLLLLFASFSALAQENNSGWIARSNENAKLLLDVYARYRPEGAGELGVQGLDEKISTPLPGRQEQRRRDLSAAIGVLQSRLATEKDPLVKQDLEISSLPESAMWKVLLHPNACCCRI
jgi:hypothetical protein